MGEPGRRNIGNEKRPGNSPAEAARKADREKMKELARQKKVLDEELDELKGNTVKGKAVCMLVFLLLTGLLLGLSVGIVKLDVGGVASTLLSPLIGDVPIARSILPGEMQRKSPSELAAEQAAFQTRAEAEQTAAQAAAEAEQAAAQAAAEAEQAAAQAAAEAEQAAVQAQAEAEALAEAATQAQAEAEAAKALQDYVDTYSAMKPQDAAKLFEGMMPDQEDVVISILEKLTPEARAAILSNMSITNAADLTEKMQHKVEEQVSQ